MTSTNRTYLPPRTETTTAPSSTWHDDIDAFPTIKPGSRPSSKFDNDPTVACNDNPDQTKCLKYSKNELDSLRFYNISYYNVYNQTESNIEFITLSCADFYNASDNLLLWWQALQREFPLSFKQAAIFSLDEEECQENRVINFYIREDSKSGQQYVDFRDNTTDVDNILNVCFSSTNQLNLTSHYMTKILQSFINCFVYYGVDLAKSIVIRT